MKPDGRTKTFVNSADLFNKRGEDVNVNFYVLWHPHSRTIADLSPVIKHISVQPFQIRDTSLTSAVKSAAHGDAADAL